MTRRLVLASLASIFCLAVTSTLVLAADKTVTGKSACATCDGVTSAGHNIMIVDEGGTRWVLIGDNNTPGYKDAHKVRKQGKTMTATLAGDPVTKKDSNGKEYKEVKVSDVKVG